MQKIKEKILTPPKVKAAYTTAIEAQQRFQATMQELQVFLDPHGVKREFERALNSAQNTDGIMKEALTLERLDPNSNAGRQARERAVSLARGAAFEFKSSLLPLVEVALDTVKRERSAAEQIEKRFFESQDCAPQRTEVSLRWAGMENELSGFRDIINPPPQAGPVIASLGPVPTRSYLSQVVAWFGV